MPEGTSEVSSDYRCARCDAHGVKLWRQYSAFADNIRLRCVRCACADQGPDARLSPEDFDAAGKHESRDLPGMRTDQIGWLVPAVPDSEGSFWGYTSVPQDRIAWWRALPTHEVRDAR
jgi:hypothetical protein